MAETGRGYSRPADGFRFVFEGVKTNAVPDAIPQNKYAYAQNIRGTRGGSVRARGGMQNLFATTASIITNIASYSVLNTDNSPLFLCRNGSDEIYLGTTNVGSLASGSSSSLGASMIPFRPAESPNPWIYVANNYDYQKFSAPVSSVVTQQAVGIAEPQSPCDAALNGPGSQNLSLMSPQTSYALAGTASAATSTNRMSAQTVVSVFADPANPSALYTVGVTAGTSPIGTNTFTRQMALTINGVAATVQNVYPGQPNAILIQNIYYYSGSTGRCIVIPLGMDTGPGTDGQSIYVQNLLASLQRGALITFAGGTAETCMILSVTLGPDGTVCFEVSTVHSHTPLETFTSPEAIQVYTTTAPVVGQTISSLTLTVALSGQGVGTVTYTPGGTPLFAPSYAFQDADYIHFGINFSVLALMVEAKILFDVGDGSFTQNFYYYTVRVADVEAAVQNTLTQLGAAQLVAQRAVIDEEDAAAARNQGTTSSGAQTTPGDLQWAEIIFPISALNRVGSDQTKSLQNVGKVQILFNTASATGTGFSYPINAQLGYLTIWGSYSPDVGLSGAPYMYRARPRSSLTGVKGNATPNMRYGVSPLREQVLVSLPSASYDSQIDTWDIFRYGGTVTAWRKIGQTASTNSTFLDNYSDAAALSGELLEEDNLQPWPTIDAPLNVTANFVQGTIARVTVTGTTNILRYLPGNLVRLGSINVYTLWTRPTSLGGSSYLLQFVENAGFQSGVPCQIYEPLTAQQRLPYMWGPDAAGTVFACGDPLRPGTLSFAKNYAPDAVPDSYNIEITAPSEPLLGGEVIDGLSFVASTERWWALYPQPSNPLQRYSVVQQPIPRGLAAPWGHCSDGKSIYWWAKDGIWSSDRGSLTDADLYTLFPHEGIAGENYIYGSYTIYAPNYSQAGYFRLACRNGFLFATYPDASGVFRCLTLELATGAWVPDTFPVTPTVFYAPPQQEGSVLGLGSQYPLLVAGDLAGNVNQPTDLAGDWNGSASVSVSCAAATREWDGGDVRASEQWGDLWLYALPASSALTCQPMSLGAAVGSPTTIAKSSSQQQSPISLGGETLLDFLGLLVTWADTYSGGSLATTLNAWQPSYISKPETIADRYTDWYDGGTEAAKYVQGFLLHADTGNVVKGLAVYDGDSLAAHSFAPAVQHNGESIKAYSFNVPFIAHTMRLQPTDQTPWRFFDVDWIFEPTPEMAETWTTQATSFGFNGYSHIQRIVAAYAATAAVTLTITAFDGTSPAIITLPSTSGAYHKLLQVCTFNKGQLYQFSASSSAPFQLFLDDFEVLVGSWSRQGAYLTWKSLGAHHGVQATV
jgi:hypothetical protein